MIAPHVPCYNYKPKVWCFLVFDIFWFFGSESPRDFLLSEMNSPQQFKIGKCTLLL